jgi:hypothetical protein
MLTVNLSACSTPERRKVFRLSPAEHASAQTLEQSKQVIIQRLNWLGNKSFKIDLKDEIQVTLTEQRGFSFDDDVLKQIFLAGLVEWVDVGPRQYDRGDAIDRNHIQLTILVWKDLEGQVLSAYDLQKKKLRLEFYPASPEIGRLLTMSKFDSADPGIHNLCLIRDGIVFSCSQITLPVSSDSCMDYEPILDNGVVFISIPPGFDSSQHDINQVDILASQIQSGPLPIRFSVKQE